MDRPVIEKGHLAPNRITVLHVSGSDQDQQTLRRILGRSNWVLYAARNCAEAVSVCSKREIPVLVCDSHLPDGDWKSLIDHLESAGVRPALVVTSDVADNRMWAEVLNLGAYDLLLKPFDALEVLRAVALAWHSHRRSSVLSAASKIGPKEATAPAQAAFAAAG